MTTEGPWGAFKLLEEQVMRMLLSGDDEALSTMRAQFGLATVSSRKMTGVGFFTHFALPASAPRLVGMQNFELTDVHCAASNVAHGIGFVLFVRGGVLYFLEGFTYDQPWPDEVRDPVVTYLVSSDGVTNVNSPCGGRDMVRIRKILRGTE